MDEKRKKPPDPKQHTVVASISGGKDSAALSLWLVEQGIEHRRVFMDTGWEHAKTYEYLRGPLTEKLGPIEEIRAELQMVQLIRKKGMFPSRKHKWCTSELKIKPMQAYIRTLQDEVGEIVNAVGIRRGESESRASALEWEWSDGFDCYVWRPLVEWSEQDVIDIHARHNLVPNPLYLQGARRVGCWPCISSRKSEIRVVADTDPARIEQIRALEQATTEIATQRYAERGETFESLGYGTPAFFQSPSGPLRGQPLPIDQMVAWSRTAYGGKEYAEPEPADAGCVRWGLCDTIGDDTTETAEVAEMPDEKRKKPANQHRITPASVLDPVKEFMPKMALDPCWNSYALTDAEFVCDGVTVDGLTADWHAAVVAAEGGGIFVNPPWGDPAPWIDKIVAESDAHQRSDSILLWLLCHPETAVGKRIWENATRICIWGRRVNHPEPPIDESGVLISGGAAVISPAGSMWPTWLAYFGRDTERFEEVFSKYGTVIWGWNCQQDRK